jgi:hypothetical protein
VRLVDGEERDARAVELRQEPLVVEALRRDVEQLQRAGAQPLEDRPLLRRVEARVEPLGVDPAPLQEVDLILHQGDQRRDDDRQPVEEQRRQLVAEALAGAGREHGERRPAGEKGADDLLLAGTERAEPEALREHVERRLVRVRHPAEAIGLP